MIINSHIAYREVQLNTLASELVISVMKLHDDPLIALEQFYLRNIFFPELYLVQKFIFFTEVLAKNEV